MNNEKHGANIEKLKSAKIWLSIFYLNNDMNLSNIFLNWKTSLYIYLLSGAIQDNFFNKLPWNHQCVSDGWAEKATAHPTIYTPSCRMKYSLPWPYCEPSRSTYKFLWNCSKDAWNNFIQTAHPAHLAHPVHPTNSLTTSMICNYHKFHIPSSILWLYQWLHLISVHITM